MNRCRLQRGWKALSENGLLSEAGATPTDPTPVQIAAQVTHTIDAETLLGFVQRHAERQRTVRTDVLVSPDRPRFGQAFSGRDRQERRACQRRREPVQRVVTMHLRFGSRAPAPMRSNWPRIAEGESEASRSLRFCGRCESCSVAGEPDSVGCNPVFLALPSVDEQDPEVSNAASRSTVRL